MKNKSEVEVGYRKHGNGGSRLAWVSMVGESEGRLCVAWRLYGRDNGGEPATWGLVVPLAPGWRQLAAAALRKRPKPFRVRMY